MQSSHSSLPTHPSLPVAPHLWKGASHAPFSGSTPAAGGSYPPQMSYPPYPQYTMSSHYAQAYAQYGQPVVGPSPSSVMTLKGNYYSSSHLATSASSLQTQPSLKPRYPAGSVRCKKEGCSYYGSASAVETHMMDRHLIYPPRWKERKTHSDWDADPTLKGKRIPIQGTTLSLDTPETIEEWIQERRKRFPTTARVFEKQEKMEEARKRGQLDLGVARFPDNKRQRMDEEVRPFGAQGRGRGGGKGYKGKSRVQREMGRGRGLWVQQGSHGATTARGGPQTVPSHSSAIVSSLENSPSAIVDLSSGSASDGEPEMQSSKSTAEILNQLFTPENNAGDSSSRLSADSTVPLHSIRLEPLQKATRLQPRRPIRNSFDVRPSLLRNLLLPEIRTTVSNLSQAIHFLVDNEFLENVELKPGQAGEKMIEVIESLE